MLERRTKMLISSPSFQSEKGHIVRIEKEKKTRARELNLRFDITKAECFRARAHNEVREQRHDFTIEGSLSVIRITGRAR